MKRIFILSFFIFNNILFGDVVNSIVGIVGSMPITYEDFISRRTFLTLQAKSIGQNINDDLVYKDLVEERIMYLKLQEYNYTIEENDVSRRLDSIAKQYNMTLEQFSKQLRAEGISYEEYRNSIKKQIAMENLSGLVVNNSDISDSEADEFYNNSKDKSIFEVDTLVKLSWIFFKATTFTEKGEKQQIANTVRGLAARGGDFSELAKKYSEDNATKNSGGDKTYYAKEHLIKTFVGAVIVDYRTVKERTEPDAGVTHQDVIHHTGEYTVGAIYKMAINVNEARRLFADAGGGPTDGAYEFVAARKMIWFFAGGFTQDTSLFVRQFYNTNFMEVLVLNPYANEGNTYCLGVDSYYAYYGNYRVGEGATPPIDGFTAQNYPYMTDEKLYLAQRPETIIPLLNHTTTFTDASRWWSFLALPGHKY